MFVLCFAKYRYSQHGAVDSSVCVMRHDVIAASVRHISAGRTLFWSIASASSLLTGGEKTVLVKGYKLDVLDFSVTAVSIICSIGLDYWYAWISACHLGDQFD